MCARAVGNRWRKGGGLRNDLSAKIPPVQLAGIAPLLTRNCCGSNDQLPSLIDTSPLKAADGLSHSEA